MVFAVSPPWGPWSDNIVPLVRLSRCLIRTANGAYPFRASVHPPAGPLIGLQHLARKLEKETEDLNSIAVFLRRPRESGIEAQERPVGLLFPGSRPGSHLSAVDWPKALHKALRPLGLGGLPGSRTPGQL